MRAVVVLCLFSLCACTSSHPGRDAEADDGTTLGDGATRMDASRPGGGDIWEGYVESYSFASGSDRVRIVLHTASGDGPVTGIVVFGDGTPLPPATNPEIGYPPDFDFFDGGGARDLVFEGFEYSIVEGLVEGDRVRLSVSLGEFWRDWCALQTPVNVGDTRCIPAASYGWGAECYYDDPGGGGQVFIDCGKLALCVEETGICVCGAAGECVAEDGSIVSFDFHVDGNDGDGTVELDRLRNIHLMR